MNLGLFRIRRTLMRYVMYLLTQIYEASLMDIVHKYNENPCLPITPMDLSSDETWSGICVTVLKTNLLLIKFNFSKNLSC